MSYGPQLYRKKPVAIFAMQWDGSAKEATQVINWVISSGDRTARYHEPNVEPSFPDGRIVIDTLEGAMSATPGDYIIRDVQGEFYPCKPDIFDETYEVM